MSFQHFQLLHLAIFVGRFRRHERLLERTAPIWTPSIEELQRSLESWLASQGIASGNPPVARSVVVI